MALEKLDLIPSSVNYNYESGNDVVTIDVESGFARSRKDIENAAGMITCQFDLDRYDYQYLKAFYNQLIDRGANRFLIDILLDQPYREEYEVQIYDNSLRLVTQRGLLYVVNMKLQAIPKDNKGIDDIVLLLRPVDPDYSLLDAIEFFANTQAKV